LKKISISEGQQKAETSLNPAASRYAVAPTLVPGAAVFGAGVTGAAVPGAAVTGAGVFGAAVAGAEVPGGAVSGADVAAGAFSAHFQIPLEHI
jgi:hypothetical protein